MALYHGNVKDDFWVEEYSGVPSALRKRTRRVNKRRLEFIGWGSRPLIEFLGAIGKDTTKEPSRHDVATFIAKYINDKGLACAEKKKKVICDEILYALFGKRTFSRIKVFDMLEEHFAENHDDSDSDRHDSLEEKDNRANNSTIWMKKLRRTPRSCFAAIVPENIKLVYLKKSLIWELLKVPESFESKVVGSFIRLKSDSNDIYQKSCFQLQQVTGIAKVSGETCLRVSNFYKDIPMDMLSDDNFSEEEIEDLRDQIKNGLRKRQTVNELEMKAQQLHVDITKHWIVKELSLLQKLIDRANEKGWRRELFDHLQRRKMLQTPSEQEKLLVKVPEVIAEEVEPEATVAVTSRKTEENDCSPKSILMGKHQEEKTVPHLNPIGSSRATEVIFYDNNPQLKPDKPAVAQIEVIELNDIESEDEDKRENSPDDVIWHYFDPQGQAQGPFSLQSLKKWSDANYFDSSFKVWKAGHTVHDPVLLTHLLSTTFPC